MYQTCPDCGVERDKHGLVCKGRCDGCGDFLPKDSYIVVDERTTDVKRFCDVTCWQDYDEHKSAEREAAQEARRAPFWMLRN